MPEANNTTQVVDRAMEVAERADTLYEALLDGPKQVDYLTLFTNTTEEYDALTQEAKTIGALMFDKWGSVYQLKETSPQLPANIVRIDRPHKANTLLGSADYVIPQEHYTEVKRQLAGTEGYREIIEDVAGLAVNSYRVITVRDAAARVAISFPSLRVSERIMGIQAET